MRYDFSTSDQILRDCQKLVDEYCGSVWQVHEASRDVHDLELRLLALYGVGPVTANIFLQELRPFWPKVDPELLPLVAAVAANVGVDFDQYERKSLTFVRIEAGLIRLRHEHQAPLERLVPVSCADCSASTSGLSTWWSSTALGRDLVLRRVSRLDAFSGPAAEHWVGATVTCPTPEDSHALDAAGYAETFNDPGIGFQMAGNLCDRET